MVIYAQLTKFNRKYFNKLIFIFFVQFRIHQDADVEKAATYIPSRRKEDSY